MLQWKNLWGVWGIRIIMKDKLKRLIIIGAGGFGREVLEYSLDVLETKRNMQWYIGGFIDDNLEQLKDYNQDYHILGTIKDHKISDKNVYICAIADPKIKAKICMDFRNRGASFINIIHPLARVGRNCKIGVGNIICPNACMTTDVKLGDFILINCHTNCGHDSIIGDFSTVSPFCDITGFAKLEQGVFLGSHVSVCPSVNIGSFAKIGAGATVISNIQANCTAVGVPAKIVKNYI